MVLVLSQRQEAGAGIARGAMGRAHRGQEILGAHHVGVVRLPVGFDALPATAPEDLGALRTLARPGLGDALPAGGALEGLRRAVASAQRGPELLVRQDALVPGLPVRVD